MQEVAREVYHDKYASKLKDTSTLSRQPKPQSPQFLSSSRGQPDPEKSPKYLSTTFTPSPLNKSLSKDTIERLYKSNQKKHDVLVAALYTRRLEEREPKTSQMSEGSKKLLKGKSSLPLYSKTRLEQLAKDRKDRLQEKRQELAKQLKLAEEEALAVAAAPYRGQELKAQRLCFDPLKVRSVALVGVDSKPGPQETSEDKEVRRYCRFRPKVDPQSARLAALVQTRCFTCRTSVPAKESWPAVSSMAKRRPSSWNRRSPNTCPASGRRSIAPRSPTIGRLLSSPLSPLPTPPQWLLHTALQTRPRSR